MHCPVCGHGETKVIDSRLSDDGSKVRRRRECMSSACGERFTTYEYAEILLPIVIKQNGNRERFNPDKLRQGLLRATEKRPVTADTVNRLIQDIEQKMRSTGEREVPSRQIGEWVMDELKNIDRVAYVRFASVYLSFADVDAFQQTIAELNKEE